MKPNTNISIVNHKSSCNYFQNAPCVANFNFSTYKEFRLLYVLELVFISWLCLTFKECPPERVAPRCSVKKALKNLAKFTEKHLCQSPFINKVPGLRPASLLSHRPASFFKNVTLPHLFFKHFASKNQLPGFGISGTLVGNALIHYSPSQKL